MTSLVTTTENKPRSAEATPIESVQQAIKQTRPFRNRRQEAVIGMLLSAESVRWPFQDMLAQHDGLTLTQYNVLRILRGAGPKGLPTLEIAERMVERTPGVTRLLDRLELKGLVARERSSADRRQVICRLLPAGRALLSKLDRPVNRLEDAITAGLDDGEVATLIRLLDKLRHRAPDGS